MVLKIGHRGAMGYESENTLRSFKKAIELKVDMVELDVHVCKSGELVVIHDDRVDRTTDGKGYVSEKSAQELRKLDAGKGDKIPTLREVLDFIDRRVKVNIELKGEGTAKPVSKLVEEYVSMKDWSYEDFLISSFNYNELIEFSKLNPKVKIGFLITYVPSGFLELAEKINAHSVNISMEFVNERFVQDAHKRGIKVFVWKVNDIEDIEKMVALGVDGIFSDFPDRLSNKPIS